MLSILINTEDYTKCYAVVPNASTGENPVFPTAGEREQRARCHQGHYRRAEDATGESTEGQENPRTL